MSANDAAREQVEAAFPELERIADEKLREGVVDAWTTAMAEGGVADLAAVPWFPPAQRELGLEDATLVEHVRDVTAAATGLAATLAERGYDVSSDTVVAGALVHDVSKLYEFDGMETTPIGDLLGHPHYGVHAVAAAGLPVEVAHVVLAHTRRTAVDPATIEAEVVRRADEVAAAALRGRAGENSTAE